VVTVVEVTAGRVRIGIEAPRSVRVARGELLDRADRPVAVGPADTAAR
jgi:sRNA-binding carbon storage regulator CsrA